MRDLCKLILITQKRLELFILAVGRLLPRGVAAASILLFFSGVQMANARSNEAIQVALTSDIRSTNPGVNRDANTDTVMMHLLEGLVAYREDGTPGLLLADSLDISADRTTYTFHLRDGVKFHNGALLTAKDVVWTWHRYLDPKTGWSCLAKFDGSHGNKIESIKAKGKDTVIFTLNHPQPLFLTEMAAIQCGGGAILHPSSVNSDGSWRYPVATGPYKLGEWKHGQYIKLEAFKGYKSRSGPRDGNTGGKMAYASSVKWVIIRDSAARLAALAKGQVQVVPELPAAEMVQARKMADVKVVSKPMLVIYGLLIQNHDPLMKDVRIRQALAASIDRNAIANLATEGVGVANASVIPTLSPYHGPAEKVGQEYDLAKARELLNAAGYDGSPIVLTTNRRYPAMFNQAILTQSMARQAGINIKLEIVEWATQMNLWLTGKYQIMSFGFSARADAYQSFETILGSRDISQTKIWNNPKALRLLQEAGNTAVRTERQAIFDQLHSLLIEDCPMIVFFSPSDVNAVRTAIHGFSSWAFGRARFWGVWREG